MNTWKSCARIFDMVESPQQPIHWDKHRRPINLTLLLALGVAFLGLLSFMKGDGSVLLIMGLAVSAYTWLTSPKHYLIFPNSLVILYGTPRRRIIPFTNISHVELLSLPPVGDRLRVVLVNGRRVMLMATDSATFHDRLEEALDKFRGGRPAEGSSNGGSLNEGQP